jgi:hypothetical protein
MNLNRITVATAVAVALAAAGGTLPSASRAASVARGSRGRRRERAAARHYGRRQMVLQSGERLRPGHRRRRSRLRPFN